MSPGQEVPLSPRIIQRSVVHSPADVVKLRDNGLDEELRIPLEDNNKPLLFYKWDIFEKIDGRNHFQEKTIPILEFPESVLQVLMVLLIQRPSITRVLPNCSKFYQFACSLP
jgi:hypothetical protein